MVDLEKYTSTIGNVHTFEFAWGKIHGPEAEDGSHEQLTLRYFADALTTTIADDCSLLTEQSVSIRLTEGEAQGSLDNIQPHWSMTMRDNRWITDGALGIDTEVRQTGRLCYVARSNARPELNYCGVFEVVVDIRSDKDVHAQEVAAAIAKRIISLACVAYQLQIVTHYPEWQTDYLNAPIISEL